MKRIQLTEEEKNQIRNLHKSNSVIKEKRGSTTDREEERHVVTHEEPCEISISPEQGLEHCDFYNTGMYWDQEACECVPLIV